MKIKSSKNEIKEVIDNLLLINLFLVFIFAFFFLFSIIMRMNGVNFFIDFFQKIWNPIIVPLISILIFSMLLNGIISWLQRKVLASKEDI